MVSPPSVLVWLQAAPQPIRSPTVFACNPGMGDSLFGGEPEPKPIGNRYDWVPNVLALLPDGVDDKFFSALESIVGNLEAHELLLLMAAGSSAWSEIKQGKPSLPGIASPMPSFKRTKALAKEYVDSVGKLRACAGMAAVPENMEVDVPRAGENASSLTVERVAAHSGTGSHGHDADEEEEEEEEEEESAASIGATHGNARHGQSRWGPRTGWTSGSSDPPNTRQFLGRTALPRSSAAASRVVDVNDPDEVLRKHEKGCPVPIEYFRRLRVTLSGGATTCPFTGLALYDSNVEIPIHAGRRHTEFWAGKQAYSMPCGWCCSAKKGNWLIFVRGELGGKFDKWDLAESHGWWMKRNGAGKCFMCPPCSTKL